MRVRVKIEDSLSEYLERLHSLFNEEKEEILRTATRVVTGEYGDKYAYIPFRMSTKFNPNLYMSGQEEDRWIIEKDGPITHLYFNYTGMTYQRRFVTGGTRAYIENEEYGDNYFKVWWEFATESTREKKPSQRVLGRDYAYFQETGMDSIAKKKYAKHPRAIRDGLHAGTPEMMFKIEEYVSEIMKRAE